MVVQRFEALNIHNVHALMNIKRFHFFPRSFCARKQKNASNNFVLNNIMKRAFLCDDERKTFRGYTKSCL